jgi:hypothetical protein
MFLLSISFPSDPSLNDLSFTGSLASAMIALELAFSSLLLSLLREEEILDPGQHGPLDVYLRRVVEKMLRLWGK